MATNNDILTEALTTIAALCEEDVVGNVEYQIIEEPHEKSVFAQPMRTLTLKVSFVEGQTSKKLRLAALERELKSTKEYLYQLESLIKNIESELHG